MPNTPQAFLTALASADHDQMLRLWSRVQQNSGLSYGSSAVASAARDTLNQIEAQQRQSDLPGPVADAVLGAMYAIVRCIREHPESSYQHCRDLSEHFDSCNPSIAFIAIRQFEAYLSERTIFVADRLVSVASGPPRPQTPCPMSVPVSPHYVQWSQLTDARQECVSGCYRWTDSDGAPSPKYRTLARQITRYSPIAT